MTRFTHIAILLAMLLSTSLPALAQDDPNAGIDTPLPTPESPDPPASTGAVGPTRVEPVSIQEAERQRLLAAEQRMNMADAAAALTLGGDWSNAAALGCFLPLGVANNAAFIAGLAAPPPTDRIPARAEYAANLALKFCAPAVVPPSDRVAAYNLDENGKCGFTFEQVRFEGKYSNYLGMPLPWADVFPGRSWGDFGEPVIGHWNTDVDVSLRIPSSTDLGNNEYRLPVGLHTLTYRGDTVMGFLDFVPRYFPGWAWERLNKLLKLRGFAEEATETTVETVLDLWAGTWQFPESWHTEWHTMTNEESQRVAVLDQLKPQLSGPANIAIEAIEPGGISRQTLLSLLRRSFTVTDNCDAAPELIATNEAELPAFVPVESSYELIWIAEDKGPFDLDGHHNQSGPRGQTFTVQDTLPPIIVPPPDIVIESASLPAPVTLGHPGTFDLADLNPAVSHNACSLPGVQCGGGVTRFPAGKTTVTWTAVDHVGNTSTTEQYVNIKPVGSNRAPSASNAAAEAISYEEVTLQLHANDPDGDRLWFKIEDQPQNGFFHSPLYPYFIQDYRLENVEEIDFGTYCDKVENRGTYIPTNWPVDARFMAVADDGTVYVQDNGIARCGSFDNNVSRDYRVAIFHPDGSWDEVQSSFDVKDMEVDWRQERLYTARHNIGGTFSLIRIFDLDLNPIVTYRSDSTSKPFREPKNVAIDFDRNLLYVTNGYQYVGSATLWVMKLPQPGPDHDPRTYLNPEFLAEYTVPGGHAWQDLALDSAGNLYASERDDNRIYKWSASGIGANGSFTPGELIGWMGRCESGPGCDSANGRSFGYSCTDATCSAPTTSGDRPGQFDFPRAIALDNNDILYATDYNNLRVQRFTPEGYFAGQAISECDGSCFVLGDFGSPQQVTVNSSHFYVLDDGKDLLHVFETTPLTRIADNSAEIVYQSDNNFTGTDTFSFSASDGLAESAAATVSIHIKRNHRPPVAIGPLAITTSEDTRVMLPLDGYDPDGALDTLTFRVVDKPANGRVLHQGNTYFYEPARDFEGTDAFTYAAFDGTFRSEPEPVSVTVIPVNDPARFPDGNEINSPSGFALRTAGVFAPGRMARLGGTAEPLKIGRGFKTAFSIAFEDPDNQDTNMVTVNWGDGSPLEKEGKLLEDGSMTGPVLAEGVSGGSGSVTAEHIFSSSGSYNIQFCVSDNAAVDGAGNKSLTAASTTACTAVPVNVLPMVDLMVDIQPTANPYALGDSLGYNLVVTNNAPASGSGLAATGITVIDTLDTRLSVAGASSSAGSCSTEDNKTTCSLSSLAPGQSSVIEIAVQVPDAIEAGMVLANHVVYDVDQENQADVQQNGELVTVVAAADYVVNTIADGADAVPGDGSCATAAQSCSLRAAVEEANAQGGAKTISLADWQITLQSELTVLGDLTISGLGAGKTIVGTAGESGLFNVAGSASLALESLTLQGSTKNGSGGAINNLGETALRAVQVSGNHASIDGGAIWNGGTLTIHDSSISGNSAGEGAGGIANSGTLILNNATISGNRGQNGGLASTGTATLNSVTLSGNYAETVGGGLRRGAGVVTLRNTILEGNTADGGGPDCSGGFTSKGYNLLGDQAGCNIAGQKPSDVLGKRARLDDLALNGGATFSHALRGGSPAIDAGVCDLPADQRGWPRPIDGDLNGSLACDIGAFEFQPVQVVLPLIMRR